MRADALEQLRNDRIDWRYKGFPPADGVTPATVKERHWNLLKGDMFLPALVLRESALAHNLWLMRRWCEARGVWLSPHGKTTMSPEVFARQLEAGAWAITAATPSQIRVYRAFGIDRILLANELVEPGSIRWIADELERDPRFELYCLADSVAAVRRMESALAGRTARRRISVLVEMGFLGGRTGARTVAEVMEVARAVVRSPVLRLAGAECYEGVMEELPPIDAFLTEFSGLIREMIGSGVLSSLDEVIITAGGSEAFDRVVEHLAVRFDGIATRLVLRSGCYVTHDDGVYDERSPLGSHRGAGGEQFHAALEAWGVVLSRPEPGLALACLGRRDVPFDSGYPIPLYVHDGKGVRNVRGVMTVEALNDQHAFIHLPANDPLAVGDLIGCGISHPCTAFDKWRLIGVVDDDYNVVDAIHTFF